MVFTCFHNSLFQGLFLNKQLRLSLSLFKEFVYVFSFQQDVAWLAKRLGNLQGFYRVNLTEFNHLDFLWATNVDQLLYNKLISLLPFSY